MKVKKIVLLCSAALCFKAFSAEIKSDSGFFSEISSAFNAKSYPQVIEYAAQMEKQFPHSTLLQNALCMKAKSYYSLKKYDQALETFRILEKIPSLDVLSKIENHFYSGLIFTHSNDYVSSLNEYYKASKIYLENKAAPKLDPQCEIYFYKSLMNSAFCYNQIEDYKKAVPLFEEAIQHRKYFSNDEFENSVVLLFESYQKQNLHQRLLKVYEKFPETEGDFYCHLTILAGESCEALKNYSRAYELYEKASKIQGANYNVHALKKAYHLYTNHRDVIKKNPAQMIEQSNENLQQNKNLLAEFWTRLAADEFKSGSMENAKKYFKTAQEYDEQKNFKPFIDLYLACMSEKNELELLENAFKENNINQENEFYFDYELNLLKFCALEKKYFDALVHAEKIDEYLKVKNIKNKNPLEYSYWKSFALYAEKKTEQSERLLEENIKSENFLLDLNDEFSKAYFSLYAHVLLENSKIVDATKILEELCNDKNVSSQNKNDYLKALFITGNNSKVIEFSKKSSSPQAIYVAALAYFNQKNWEQAELCFSKYLSANYSPYAEFYSGYCQYKTGKILSAEKTLSEFCKKNPKHNLSWNACITLCSCSLLNRNFSGAAEYAKKSLDAASSKEQEQHSILLASSAYSDNGDIQSAQELLKSSGETYAKTDAEFSLRCYYELAQLYARQGNTRLSEKYFLEVQNKTKNSLTAQEACFRRGELYFNAKNYQTAILRFKEYQQKFPDGKFLDSSYYYTALSYQYSGKPEQAKMSFEFFIQKFPESQYAKNVQDALSSMQAKSEPEEISLQKKFENAGGSSTKEGRKIGTELAKLLWKNTGTQEQAYLLAQEILLKQTNKNEAEESLEASDNAMIVADYLRLSGESKEAAQYYLSCAKYSKMSNLESKTQRSLYGAIEAFAACNLFSDAKLIFDELESSAPASDYTKKAKTLLNLK